MSIPISLRRGELLAELFLQDLGPISISQPTSTELGYDFLVGFSNKKSGINTIAIQLKVTQRPMRAFRLARSTFDRITNSNLPFMLLVADVKHNELYYAWLAADEVISRGKSISLPLIAIDEVEKNRLRKEFHGTNGHVGVAV